MLLTLYIYNIQKMKLFTNQKAIKVHLPQYKNIATADYLQ